MSRRASPSTRGDAEQLGDLVVGVALELPEDEDRAQGGGGRVERTREVQGVRVTTPGAYDGLLQGGRVGTHRVASSREVG